MRILVFFGLFLMLFGCSTGGETWARIERDKVLRVGLDPSFPPFETLENDALSGIDVALSEQIGEALGVAVQFDIIGYDGLYDALLTGRVDVLASALIVDETRTKAFRYSEPYFNAGQVMVMAEGAAGVDSAEFPPTTATTIAVELGAAGHVLATQHQQRNSAITIAKFETAQAALEAVAAGEADVAFMDSVSAYLFLAQQDGLAVAAEPLTVDPYALVVRVEDGVLLEKLNEGLGMVDVDAILDGYFSAEK